MLIKKIFIIFLMCLSFNISSQELWTVKDIQCQGLRNITKNEFLTDISFHIGSKISKLDIKNNIQSLFKTGRFESIKVVFLNETILFKIQERPMISNISISGNSIIDTSRLKKILRQLHIEEGNVFNPVSINELIHTLKNFYYDVGKYNSDIQILKVFSANNLINLKIFINEGVSIKTNKINLSGIKKFSRNKIKSLFKLRDSCNSFDIFHQCIYSPKKLDDDLNSLKNFYLNHGYLNFHIEDKKIDYVKNNNYVNVTLNLHEGEQYKISDFFVHVDFFPYRKIIENMINFENGEVYNQEKIAIVINNIKILLLENGYIDHQISVDPEINDQNKTIKLNFTIKIKKRFSVRNISFRGNEKIQDQVLRRFLKQKEGEWFNFKLIESGKQELEKTQYFNNVDIIQDIDSIHKNQVNITYKVIEKPTGSVNFGIGYGKDSGLSLNAFFSQENIFGSSHSVKMNIVKNNIQNYVDLETLFPDLIFNSADLNTRLFFNHFKYNFNKTSDVTKKTYGFEANINTQLDDNNKINFGIGYTHNGVVNSQVHQKNIHLSGKLLDAEFLNNEKVNDFTLNYSWIFNSLKYDYFPISGNKIYIHGKNTIPGSDNNFYKFTADSIKYVPLNDQNNFIFFHHIHMGLGNGFNQKKLPFYENFYADSENNIRGFDLKTIGPKNIDTSRELKNCKENLCHSVDSIGGNAIFINNLEVIFPLPLINDEYSKFVRSSCFLDFGKIWDVKYHDKNSDMDRIKNKYFLNNLYLSYGISLQWFSPIGPVSLSYAFPIHTDKMDKTEQFQFNFGQNWQ